MPVQPHNHSVHRLINLVGSGKIGFDKMLKKPMRRFGAGVKSQRPIAESPNLAKLAELIEKHETQVRLWRTRKRVPVRLVQYEARAELLKKLRDIGFKPHAYHLTAALAMQHGFTKEKLMPLLNSLNRIDTYSKGAVFKGALRPIYSAVSLDLITKVHNSLHKTGKAMNIQELVTELGLPYNMKNRESVMSSLAILDLLHLTHKLPAAQMSRYKWVHSCYRLTKATVPTWNLDWQALQQLRSGEKTLGELSREVTLPSGHKMGSPTGIAAEGGVKEIFFRLQKVGLIKVEERFGGLAASLTDYGKKLLAKQEKTNYLLPELRIALLRLPMQKGEPPMAQQRMFRKLMRWLRVKKAILEERRIRGVEERSYGERNTVAHKLKETRDYVQRVQHGIIEERTLKLISIPTLKSHFETLKTRHPELAPFLEEYIKSKEASEGRPPEEQ